MVTFKENCILFPFLQIYITYHLVLINRFLSIELPHSIIFVCTPSGVTHSFRWNTWIQRYLPEKPVWLWRAPSVEMRQRSARAFSSTSGINVSALLSGTEVRQILYEILITQEHLYHSKHPRPLKPTALRISCRGIQSRPLRYKNSEKKMFLVNSNK